MRRIAALLIAALAAAPHIQAAPHVHATALHAPSIGHSPASCAAAAGVPDEATGLHVCVRIVQEGALVRMDALGVPGMYCAGDAVYASPNERALLTPSAFQIAGASGALHWSWPRAPYRAWGDTVYGDVVCSPSDESAATNMRMVTYTVRWTGTDVPAFPLRVWVDPSSMPGDAHPTLHARTTPGARCSASIMYNTEPLVPFNARAQTVPASGQVDWSWHEETSGPGGLGTVACTFNGASRSASAAFSVTPSAFIAPL